MTANPIKIIIICCLMINPTLPVASSTTTESLTSEITEKRSQENSASNQVEVSNPHEIKDAVSLFFQVIKMYKKWHSDSKSNTYPWTTALNKLRKNQIRSDIPSKILTVTEIDGNKSSIAENAHSAALMNISDTTELSETQDHKNQSDRVPEASALIGRVPPIKIQGKKKYLVGGSATQPSSKCSKFCAMGHHTIGLCVPSTECYMRGGSASALCCGTFHVCCKFTFQCSETSQEELSHFQSPDYPVSQKGALACDFELIIRPRVCAVRIDFADVKLHPKFGGICDVDQILILNSVDGPTSAQCGDLSGYTTTVAVHPAHGVPLKLVLIIQNEDTYLWDIRLRQIECTDLKHFKKPPVCGAKAAVDTSVSFYQMLDLWRNAAWHAMGQNSEPVWWRQPAPAFNRFYYVNSRKAMEGSIRESTAEDRIIHGMDADLHEFPWQVAVVTKRIFFCGAVLINDEYVLSAAHCFLTQDTPMADLVVYLGDHDLTSSNETISEIRGVREIHYHAHFHALLLSNDIAMLRLDRPVTFSLRIRPVCLPERNLAVLGETGVVAGWGITSYPDGKPNAILQRLQVQVMSNEFCENALDENLGPGHLCAVPAVHGGTCFGDSGGPLTIVHEEKDTLIGIVSFGITGCALAPGMPDLYTRVSAYLKWIHVSAIKYLD